MILLADTNVLLRFAIRQDPQHQIVRKAVRKLIGQSDEISIFPQSCIEFWNVATRPVKNNGFGYSCKDADFFLRLIERVFPLMSDDAGVYREWRKLVIDFGVSGIQVHDGRIVAAMLVHNITHILTFNTKDFARYSSIGVIAIDPKNV